MSPFECATVGTKHNYDRARLSVLADREANLVLNEARARLVITEKNNYPQNPISFRENREIKSIVARKAVDHVETRCYIPLFVHDEAFLRCDV